MKMNTEYQHIRASNVIDREGTLELAREVSHFLASRIATSYGPGGAHTILYNDPHRGPYPTRDGLEILRSISLSAGPENIIHNMINTVAVAQNDNNGDGSSTVILLLDYLLQQMRPDRVDDPLVVSASKIFETKLSDKFWRLMETCPSQFNEILVSASRKLAKNIEESAISIFNEDGTYKEDLLKGLINTSVNGNAEMRDVLIDMFTELRNNSLATGVSDSLPLITLAESSGEHHSYELSDGMIISAHPLYTELSMPKTDSRILANPHVLIIDGRFNLTSLEYSHLLDEIEHAAQHELLSDLLVVCCGVSDGVNNVTNTLGRVNPALFDNIMIVQYPSLVDGELIKDLACALNCDVLHEQAISALINRECDLSDDESTKDMKGIKAILKMASSDVPSVRVNTSNVCFTISSKPEIKANIAERTMDIHDTIKAIKDGQAVNNTIEALNDRLKALSRNSATFYVGGLSNERKAINYELAKDAIPQVVNANKGLLHGAHVGVINTIANMLNSRYGPDYGFWWEVHTPEERCIYKLILEGYMELAFTIYKNVKGSDYTPDEFVKEYGEHSIRPSDDGFMVVGNANSEISAITNVLDMVSILITAQGLSTTSANKAMPEILPMRHTVGIEDKWVPIHNEQTMLRTSRAALEKHHTGIYDVANSSKLCVERYYRGKNKW